MNDDASTNDGLRLPALDRLAALDPDLANDVQASFDRLGRTAAAVSWAQMRVGALVRGHTAAGVLRALVTEVKLLTDAPEVWGLLLEPGDPPRIRALAPDGPAPTVPAPREVSRSIVGHVLTSGRPAWADDARADARFAASASVQGLAMRSVGCLPVGDHAVLYVADPEEPARFGTLTRLRLGALCRLAGRVLDAVEAPGEAPQPLPGMVGDSPVMHDLFAAVRAFAPMPWPALILGETGTGKELVARALHESSGRAASPFLAVNCGAIPEQLAESTLFGHERGAFTGAERRQQGLVERVGDGTLFLDEVGELSPTAQVKLLRLLEVGEYERVGGHETLPFRGRVVAATLRALDDPTDRDGFREDLFHRLAACVIRVPPLRERRDDIPALATFLLQRALSEITTPRPLTLADSAVRLLQHRTWRGNVRELNNVLRGAVARALAAGDGVIEPIHLAAAPAGSARGEDLLAITDLQQAVADYQRRVVEAALKACDGNRTAAAARLDVSRQWLHRLIARWDPDG